MREPTGICQLCGRHVPQSLTGMHHLLPRSHGGSQEHEVTLCKMCHSFLHATFSNRTLAESFDTLKSLRQDSEVRSFVSWVRKQKPHRNIEVDRREEKR